MHTVPSIFLSHGSPNMILQPSPALDFLKQLGQQLGKPRSILAISAHWLTTVPTVSMADQVETIHDFWGFPEVLYTLKYPAAGAPELAEQVTKLLAASGMEWETHASRGLDHGAWEPLMLMYPDADIPVTQLSLQPQLGTAHHLQVGRALAPMRQEGVLIMASGAATHNMQALRAYTLGMDPPEWAVAFDRWLAETIAQSNTDALLDYRRQAPYANQNHPSEEHLLPLFVALGAGGDAPHPTQLHSSFTYGVFSMAAYAFN